MGAKLLQDVPIRFMIYDLLEWEGIDYRTTPLHIRQEQLALLYQSHKNLTYLGNCLKCFTFYFLESYLLKKRKAEQKSESKLMLKKRTPPMKPEERKLVEMEVHYPNHRCRALLQCEDTVTEQTSIRLYFCPLGRGSSSHFCKAYSGLTFDKEIREVDQHVKQNA